MSGIPRTIAAYMRKLGKKGGAVKGASKARGGPEYYRALQLKSAAKRRVGPPAPSKAPFKV